MYNPEEENIPDILTADELSAEELTGSWEQKGKSLTAAAITGLLIVGAVYFNVQSILVMVITIIYKAIYNIVLPSEFIEKLEAIASELKAPLFISLIISQYFFMMAPSLWMVKKWHTDKIKKYLRIRTCSIKEIIIAVFITITALPLCYYISELLMHILNVPEEVQKLGSEFFTATTLPEFIMLVLVVAVTPAICEEIFFRGFFQRTLERTIGWKSVLWGGFLFGLFHLQPLSLIVLSILGILFSLFYFRSKSIFPSAFAHFTNNFIALFLLYSQSKSVDFGLTPNGSIPIGFVISSTLLFLFLLWLYFKITKSSRNFQKSL